MSQQIERRNVAGRVEVRAGNENLLTGLAAPFYDGTPATEYQLWPGVFERYMPGCFDKVAQDDVRCLFNHESCAVLGRTKAGTLTLAVTGRGLEYSCDLPDTQVGRDVKVSTSRGDITGSSCAWVCREERWLIQHNPDGSSKEIRELLDLGVYDVSPVTYPAYEGTEAATRAAGDTSEARRSHDEWRNRQADADEREAMAMAKARLELAAVQD